MAMTFDTFVPYPKIALAVFPKTKIIMASAMPMQRSVFGIVSAAEFGSKLIFYILKALQPFYILSPISSS